MGKIDKQLVKDLDELFRSYAIPSLEPGSAYWKSMFDEIVLNSQGLRDAIPTLSTRIKRHLDDAFKKKYEINPLEDPTSFNKFKQQYKIDSFTERLEGIFQTYVIQKYILHVDDSMLNDLLPKMKRGIEDKELDKKVRVYVKGHVQQFGFGFPDDWINDNTAIILNQLKEHLKNQPAEAEPNQPTEPTQQTATQVNQNSQQIRQARQFEENERREHHVAEQKFDQSLDDEEENARKRKEAFEKADKEIYEISSKDSKFTQETFDKHYEEEKRLNQEDQKKFDRKGLNKKIREELEKNSDAKRFARLFLFPDQSTFDNYQNNEIELKQDGNDDYTIAYEANIDLSEVRFMIFEAKINFIRNKYPNVKEFILVGATYSDKAKMTNQLIWGKPTPYDIDKLIDDVKAYELKVKGINSKYIPSDNKVKISELKDNTENNRHEYKNYVKITIVPAGSNKEKIIDEITARDTPFKFYIRSDNDVQLTKISKGNTHFSVWVPIKEFLNIDSFQIVLKKDGLKDYMTQKVRIINDQMLINPKFESISGLKYLGDKIRLEVRLSEKFRDYNLEKGKVYYQLSFRCGDWQDKNDVLDLYDSKYNLKDGKFIFEINTGDTHFFDRDFLRNVANNKLEINYIVLNKINPEEQKEITTSKIDLKLKNIKLEIDPDKTYSVSEELKFKIDLGIYGLNQNDKLLMKYGDSKPVHVDASNLGVSGNHCIYRSKIADPKNLELIDKEDKITVIAYLQSALLGEPIPSNPIEIKFKDDDILVKKGKFTFENTGGEYNLGDKFKFKVGFEGVYKQIVDSKEPKKLFLRIVSEHINYYKYYDISKLDLNLDLNLPIEISSKLVKQINEKNNIEIKAEISYNGKDSIDEETETIKINLPEITANKGRSKIAPKKGVLDLDGVIKNPYATDDRSFKLFAIFFVDGKRTDSFYPALNGENINLSAEISKLNCANVILGSHVNFALYHGNDFICQSNTVEIISPEVDINFETLTKICFPGEPVQFMIETSDPVMARIFSEGLARYKMSVEGKIFMDYQAIDKKNIVMGKNFLCQYFSFIDTRDFKSNNNDLEVTLEIWENGQWIEKSKKVQELIIAHGAICKVNHHEVKIEGDILCGSLHAASAYPYLQLDFDLLGMESDEFLNLYEARIVKNGKEVDYRKIKNYRAPKGRSIGIRYLEFIPNLQEDDKISVNVYSNQHNGKLVYSSNPVLLKDYVFIKLSMKKLEGVNEFKWNIDVEGSDARSVIESNSLKYNFKIENGGFVAKPQTLASRTGNITIYTTAYGKQKIRMYLLDHKTGITHKSNIVNVELQNNSNMSQDIVDDLKKTEDKNKPFDDKFLEEVDLEERNSKAMNELLQNMKNLINGLKSSQVFKEVTDLQKIKDYLEHFLAREKSKQLKLSETIKSYGLQLSQTFFERERSKITKYIFGEDRITELQNIVEKIKSNLVLQKNKTISIFKALEQIVSIINSKAQIKSKEKEVGDLVDSIIEDNKVRIETDEQILFDDQERKEIISRIQIMMLNRYNPAQIRKYLENEYPYIRNRKYEERKRREKLNKK